MPEPKADGTDLRAAAEAELQRDLDAEAERWIEAVEAEWPGDEPADDDGEGE